MKQRILAILLSLTMIFTLVPTAWALSEEENRTPMETFENDEGAEGSGSAAPEMNGNCGATEADHVTWALTQNNEDNASPTYTLTISGSGAMADYAVDGAPWHVALGKGQSAREKINSIILPSGLTHIGANAFLQASVTNVTIPDTVISIGTNAFWNCNTIQTALPASVQELGATAFFGTFVVNVVTDSPYFCSEADGKILYSRDKTTLYQVSQDYSSTFAIPETVTSIFDYAMYGCARVSGALTIPDSVQSIGQSAFYGTGFTSLTLGNNVKEIGKWAFQNCSGMKDDLVLPASVTSIGESAFNGTGFDGALTFNAQIEEIPNNEFTGSAFTSVTLSGRVKKIGAGAFQNCKELESVTFSDNVESIGDSAFNGCTALTSVTFGQGLQTIGVSAFAKSGLSGELCFPDSLKEIKESAFSECDKITKIIIPERSIAIEYAAFYKDTGVQQINIPLSETTFDKLAYGGYYIFTWGGSTLNTLAIGAVPEEVPISQLFASSTSGLKTLILGTGVTNENSLLNPPTLENGLYPSTLSVTGRLLEVGTKYTVSDGKLDKNIAKNMLTFDTPEGIEKPAVTYHSSNPAVITVDENGLMKAVGSVGQSATVRALYDGTTFAKVDVTIGTSAGDDFYSIDPVIADQTYKGCALKPAVKVTKNGKEITDGFTVKYDNNTNVGTATATVKVGDTVIGTATFNIVKATPTIDISAEPASLVGGGKVTLTVTGVPEEGNVTVTCDNGITVDGENGTYSAVLPNRTVDYTFTLNYTGVENGNYSDATDTCTVSVTRRHTSSVTPGNTVSVPSTPNGTMTVNPSTASKGETVTITTKPSEGYELGSIEVLDKNGDSLKLKDLGNGKYSFVMTDGKVSVEAEFVKTAATSFADVPANAYFADAVKWAVDKGITNGLPDTMFGPYESCTRAQIVTFLWRAAGSPEPKTASSFTDVPANAYYAKAVAWAVENGITNGMTETTFAPNETCTRGQSVTFLYRALKGTAGTISSFADVPANAFYADAVGWALSQKVTDGTSNTTFSPDDNCTRGQIVTFLYRAYQGK